MKSAPPPNYNNPGKYLCSVSPIRKRTNLQNALKAEVAVPIPIDKALTYSVPPAMAERLAVGMRVAVHVKTRLVAGVVVGLGEAGSGDRKLKPVRGILDEVAVITPALMDLARWMSGYYLAPLGEVLGAMSPPHAGFRQIVKLVERPGDLELEVIRATHPERASVIEALEGGKPVGLETLKRKAGPGEVAAAVEALEKEGVLATEVVPRKGRAPRKKSAGEAAAGNGASREHGEPEPGAHDLTGQPALESSSTLSDYQ